MKTTCSIFLTVFALMVFSVPSYAYIEFGSDTKLFANEPLSDYWEKVDFSQFQGGFVEKFGPIQIGDLVGENIYWTPSACGTSFISDTPCGVLPGLIGNGTFDLGVKGVWNEDRNGYVALNHTGVMRFEFEKSVKGLGLLFSARFSFVAFEFIREDGGGLPFLFAYVPTDSDSVNQGFSVALERDVADINGIWIGGDSPVADDLYFTRGAVVPEPSTIFLISAGIMGAILRRRKLNKEGVFRG